MVDKYKCIKTVEIIIGNRNEEINMQNGNSAAKAFKEILYSHLQTDGHL